MLREIFNPQNYHWNPYVIPMYIVAVLVFFEGFGVYIKNTRALTNRMYGFWLTFVTIWLLGTGTVYLATKEAVALFWYKDFAFFGVAFISFGSYLFSLSFLVSNFSRHRIIILFAILISGIFCLINISTDFIVKGTYTYFWGFYPRYTIFGGSIFLTYWVTLYIATVINLVKAYRQTKGAKKKQMLLILWGTIFVYSGASDYLAAYGIGVYPFGYVSVILYFTLIAYIIIRYRAFEIDTVIHRTTLWLVTSLWLILPAYALFSIIRPFLETLNNFWLTISALGLFYGFLWYYRYFQPKIDHFFRRRKYDYQTILGKVAEKIATTINIEDLTRQFLNEVCETMYLRNSLLYVLSKDGKNYSLIGRRGYKEVGGEKQRSQLEIYTEETRIKLPEKQRDIHSDTLLCKWLTGHKEILERELVEVNSQYQQIKEEALAWFKEQEVELIVPFILEDKVVAVLGLGRKENLQAYTIKDLELLKKLGQEAGVTVFNALHYEDLAEKERLDEEMKMGRQIQMALLPRQLPQISGLNVQGLMQPAKEIGGDYYDFVTLPSKDYLAIVIGDVSGKGVGAGILMSMVKATIHNLSQEGFLPREILLRTNKFLYQHIGGQKFMTLLYMLWQSKDLTFTYSSAGHEHILIYRNQLQKVEAIQSGGFMLGMLPDIENYLEERRIQLSYGDKILLYTDGVTEAQNHMGERFTLARLKETFQNNSQRSASELIQAIRDEVYTFIGTQAQYDDITLVVLEAK